MARTCDGLVVGPGMGKAACVYESLEALLDTLPSEATVVLDAGALGALTSFKQALARDLIAA